MKKNAFTGKVVAIVGAFMLLFILLLSLTKTYREAIHGTSGIEYFNQNPIALLSIVVLAGLFAIFLMALLIKMILDRERLMTEAAVEIRKVTNNLHAGVVNYIPEGTCRIVYASRGYYDIIGVDRSRLYELYQNSLLGFLPPEYHSFFLDTEKLEETGYTEKIVRMHDASGKKYWMQVTLSKGVHAGKKAISAVFVDVTVLKTTQDKLLHEQERYRIASELSNDVMFEYDFGKDVLTLSDLFSELFGKDHIIGYFRKDINSYARMIHPEDRRDSMNQILHTKRVGANDIQLRIMDKNGEYQWCRILYRAICNNLGEPVLAVGKISNISMYKKEIEQLDRASKTDSLTGVYNKMATKEVIDAYIRAHERQKHMFLMVDIDEFKKVNDTYGHQNGDEVLIYAVDNLKKHYTSGEILGRVGGDEFVVFIGDVENQERLIEKAQTLQTLFKKPYQNGSYEIPLSASLGISMYPDDGENFEELMYCADSALYEVKNGKKGDFAVYRKRE